MKLISVQSRGNRLVRIVQGTYQSCYGSRTGYHVWGKKISYSHEWGVTINAQVVTFQYSEKEAIRLAAEWLQEAKQ